VLLQPLFEEANRTRRLIVDMARALAARGIASVLPDLPGQGDSLTATAAVRLATMREALDGVVAMAGARAVAGSVRSGALLDPLARMAGRWQFAPQTGAELLRDLGRIRQAATGAPFDPAAQFGAAEPVEIAGNRLSGDMLIDLATAMRFAGEAPVRTVRLAADPRPADARVAGTPLWRRAEPGEDAALAEALAADLAAWIATCGG
jgi:hypothetical protein